MSEFIKKLRSLPVSQWPWSHILQYWEDQEKRIDRLEKAVGEVDHRTIGMVPMGPGNSSIHEPDPKALQKIVDGIVKNATAQVDKS